MKLSALSDKELVQFYISGNENALATLVDRHEQRIFAFIMSKVKNQALAQDFFQDTFVKVVRTLKKGKYNEEGKFLPWVMRIANNLIIDHFRKTNRFRKVNQIVGGDEPMDIFDTIANDDRNVFENIERTQNHAGVRDLINMLPDEQKEVVMLRHYYDMSFKEISVYCDVSINTALGRMRYALINMRKLMEEHKQEMLVD
jgi:RNA polymerase sigma-70 factor (ECF subfamily)